MRHGLLSRIRVKILLLALLPAAVLTAVLAWYIISTRFADLEQSFQQRGQAVARELAALSAYGVLIRNPASLRATAEEVLRRTDALRIRIIDESGKRLVDLARASDPNLAHAQAEFSASIYLFTESVAVNGYQGPPVDGRMRRDSLQLGFVRVRLVDRLRMARQDQIITNSLLLSLGGLTITAVIALVLGGRLIRPIERLTTAIRRVERGDLTTSIPVQSTGELRTLEQGFNAMAKQLHGAQSHLQDQVKRATAGLLETLEALEIRNVELDLARKRALEASRAKTEFMANVSHEIRTPMNGIIGFLNLLKYTSLNTAQQDCVNTVDSSAKNLLDIINDILDFSKFEAGGLALDPATFRIRTLFEEAVALLSPSAHEKGLELVMLIYDDVPELLVGDASRIRQILMNLVGNAIKFTDSGEVIVRVMLEGETGGKYLIRFTVTDTGGGIPSDLLPHLFTPFNLAFDANRDSMPGTGLGLAICRRLTNAMGGQITVESTRGMGSQFDVQLTLSKAAQQVDKRLGQGLAGTSVALYDNHRLSGLAIFHQLRKWAIDITRCESEEALYKCLETKPESTQAIILGLSAQQSLKYYPKLISGCRAHTDSPILVMVSCSDRNLIQAIQDQGANQCVSKPAVGTILYRHLKSLLRHDQSPDTPEAAAPSIQPNLSGFRILVADDNAINLKLVCELLQRAGARISAANNGRELLNLWLKSTFDCVFVDVHMPEVDGIEAALWIRNNDRYGSHVPIIALTADATLANQKKIIASGIDEYLIKPIDEASLWRIIERLVLTGDSSSVARVPARTPDTADEGKGLTLPVRDESAALKTTGGSADLARDLFVAFMEDLPAQFSELQRLLQKGAWGELRDTAHRVHGSTAYCGVPALNAAVQELESAANALNAEQIAAALKQVGREIERLQRSGSTA